MFRTDSTAKMRRIPSAGTRVGADGTRGAGCGAGTGFGRETDKPHVLTDENEDEEHGGIEKGPCKRGPAGQLVGSGEDEEGEHEKPDPGRLHGKEIEDGHHEELEEPEQDKDEFLAARTSNGGDETVDDGEEQDPVHARAQSRRSKGMVQG